jgi:hypothetical protein
MHALPATREVVNCRAQLGSPPWHPAADCGGQLLPPSSAGCRCVCPVPGRDGPAERCPILTPQSGSSKSRSGAMRRWEECSASRARGKLRVLPRGVMMPPEPVRPLCPLTNAERRAAASGAVQYALRHSLACLGQHTSGQGRRGGGSTSGRQDDGEKQSCVEGKGKR